jgi:hypothetical protein
MDWESSTIAHRQGTWASVYTAPAEQDNEVRSVVGMNTGKYSKGIVENEQDE